MALPPKVCPDCGEEYVHSAVSCVHCEVALVHARDVQATAAEDLPPVAELTAIRIAAAGWTRALSELLVAEGIAHRVEVVSEDAAAAGRSAAGAGPYGVYVREADVTRARAIDAEYLEREIPDLPDDWEGAAAGEGCPACGAAVAEDAAECPDCGLALG